MKLIANPFSKALKKSKPELKLIGISSSDIIDGKPSIVLGFAFVVSTHIFCEIIFIII